MQCKSCGSDLVRGFTFCLNCGMPVPPEMLAESGLPQRNIDSGPQEEAETASAPVPAEQELTEETGDLIPHLQGEDRDVGGDLKPQLQGVDSSVSGKELKPQLMGVENEGSGNALKPKYIGGEEQTAGGQGVRAAMQDSSSSSEIDGTVEKLVFCPNCGMRMQHDTSKCEACGMPLGNKPNNVPAASGGVPLFNTDSDPFASAGGFEGFGGTGGLSDEDASRIDNFINGNNDPMFYNGDSTFNVQATPNDFAELTEQLANFSAAAGIQTLDVTENTTIRQKEPEKGQEREVADFSMIGDLSSEPIPISDNGIPVIGDCSMDEDPNSNLVIDPYAFLSTSMDEAVPDLATPEPQPKTSASIPDAVPYKPGIEPISAPAAKIPQTEPIRPQTFAETENNHEEVPYIIEETLFISEQAAAVSSQKPTANTQPASLSERTGAANDRTPTFNNSVPPVSAPKPEQKNISTTINDVPDRQEKQAVQPDKGPEPVKVSQTADVPAAPARPKPAESTKKCYACGRVMPASDKFCPNCGRSTFGVPNPNLMSSAPSPAPAKKKPAALIIILIILLIAAAVAVTVFIMKKGSAEVYAKEPAQTISNAEQTLSESVSSDVTEHFALQRT